LFCFVCLRSKTAPSSVLQRSPPNRDCYSPPSQAQNSHASSHYNTNNHRGSYQQYDRSPGSDQDSPVSGYRERVPIAPSMSTHSMKGPESRDEWEDVDRRRNENRRSDSRFNDSASVISNALLNHFAGVHRRPVSRNSNLLSATLCLVKELDYPSLEVVEHAVRCRIDELAE
uniref:Uncharacterized protein n=1 Tax=Anopheles coluzzii TaxID=1518534 RepID=A0A8W7P3V0_ANOCL